MRYLFDVNVLIALLDERHPAHNLCMAWYGTQQGGTALCPLVENGAARIMASTAYAQDQLALRPGRLLLQIARMKQSADDMARFDHSKIHGPRPLTDVYLLGLAVSHGEGLVTLDRNIPLAAVGGAQKTQLLVL